MESLVQSDIEHLDDIAKYHGGEVLLPPVNGSCNICIDTSTMVDLTPIHECLYIGGFSFFQRRQKDKLYIEIMGIYNEA